MMMWAYLMTSEDWKTVLLALITGVIGPAVVWMLKKQSDTKTLLNGRLTELLQAHGEKRYAEGHAAGVAKVSQAVAESPSINLDQQAMANAVAKTVQPNPPPAA